ncbi:uncharacterized protein [Choristoneura fumiferana]|uniref:uncharacterized protein n=1 Tax=Choristoneura fumiferana TaxID=7141 RepID=UPI003D15B224
MHGDNLEQQLSGSIINEQLTLWHWLPAGGGGCPQVHDVNDTYSSLCVHGFSVAGYLWGEVCVHALKDPKTYQPVLDRVAAQVWDSAADISEISIGVPKAVFPKNQIMQKTLKTYMEYHMKASQPAAPRHYIRSSQMFHTNPCRAPALFLLSKSDPVGAERSNRAVHDSWREMGTKVTCYDPLTMFHTNTCRAPALFLLSKSDPVGAERSNRAVHDSWREMGTKVTCYDPLTMFHTNTCRAPALFLLSKSDPVGAERSNRAVHDSWREMGTKVTCYDPLTMFHTNTCRAPALFLLSKSDPVGAERSNRAVHDSWREMGTKVTCYDPLPCSTLTRAARPRCSCCPRATPSAPSAPTGPCTTAGERWGPRAVHDSWREMGTKVTVYDPLTMFHTNTCRAPRCSCCPRATPSAPSAPTGPCTTAGERWGPRAVHDSWREMGTKVTCYDPLTMFHTNTCRAPALFLLSKSDPVGAERSNRAVHDSWREMGTKVTCYDPLTMFHTNTCRAPALFLLSKSDPVGDERSNRAVHDSWREMGTKRSNRAVHDSWREMGTKVTCYDPLTMFHTNTCRAPALFLLSKERPVGAERSNRAVHDSWREMGTKCTWKCWDKSPHVQHYSHHPQEYLAALYQHLDKYGLVSQPEKMRVRL